MEIIIYIGLLAFTWLFVSGAGSVQFVKKFFQVHNDSTPPDLTRQVLIKLVNCALCSGFWIGFVHYWWNGHPHFILMACLVSVGSEIFSRIIGFLFNQLFKGL